MTSGEPVKLSGLVPAGLKIRSGKVLLDSLEVMADIGFHDFEIGRRQRLLVTVEIWLEDPVPPPADDPARAWNYDFVKGEVEEIAASGRFNLQETFAKAVFDRVSTYRGIKGLRVATAKPDIYPNARGVGIEIASFVGQAP